ncbi:hypothetical protein FGO68_gene12081 [Halteria grandinella]|uniref:Uncharacterized protein n=1 Tax=Halteria grandinella TaxID=5974 RepID=A0A8J8P4Q0_HALGN|nr:hypothetical protein FGO68_gene12081 [Halteria grandinella]
MRNGEIQSSFDKAFNLQHKISILNERPSLDIAALPPRMQLLSNSQYSSSQKVLSGTSTPHHAEGNHLPHSKFNLHRPSYDIDRNQQQIGTQPVNLPAGIMSPSNILTIESRHGTVAASQAFCPCPHQIPQQNVYHTSTMHQSNAALRNYLNQSNNTSPSASPVNFRMNAPPKANPLSTFGINGSRNGVCQKSNLSAHSSNLSQNVQNRISIKNTSNVIIQAGNSQQAFTHKALNEYYTTSSTQIFPQLSSNQSPHNAGLIKKSAVLLPQNTSPNVDLLKSQQRKMQDLISSTNGQLYKNNVQAISKNNDIVNSIFQLQREISEPLQLASGGGLQKPQTLNVDIQGGGPTYNKFNGNFVLRELAASREQLSNQYGNTLLDLKNIKLSPSPKHFITNQIDSTYNDISNATLQGAL